MQLQNCSISALLDFGVDPKTMRPWLSFAALSQLLTLHVNGLVYMSFSRDWNYRFSDESEVLEVECEYRNLTEREITLYGWQLNSISVLPKFTIISIEGPLFVKIICDSYEIGFEPLSRKFPDMV